MKKKLAILSADILYWDEVDPRRDNIIAKVTDGDDIHRLVFICHMDTVPIGEEWDSDIDTLGEEIR